MCCQGESLYWEELLGNDITPMDVRRACNMYDALSMGIMLVVCVGVLVIPWPDDKSSWSGGGRMWVI